jgi:competence protein ComEC
LPFLRSRGIDHIDRLVISHDDIDHSGGLPDLLAGVTVGKVSAGQPRQLPKGAGIAPEPCHEGERWQWDGISFRFLHPPPDWRDRRDNNASCVLQIRAHGHRLLITGDAETKFERKLLRQQGKLIAADILVAGHHGSNSSSSAEFLEAVGPKLVLFANGYLNRYGFPRQAVMARVRDQGAVALSTAQQGAVRITIDPEQGMRVRGYRHAHPQLWSNAPPIPKQLAGF